MSDGNMGPRLERLLPPALREAVLVLALIAATTATYSIVNRNPFIFLDDYGYVVTNSHIQQLNWETVKWAFTTYRAANWHPLTWLSHALDWHLFGLDAGRHHETNLLLHVLNVVTLFWILSQATGRRGRSFMVAALFALHPINVESVAWVAERKNLLSMFFFLLALGAYYTYARKPRVTTYLVVACLYALGLMCKPQIVTMPFVLLLWDYWPLRRMFPPERVHSVAAADEGESSGAVTKIVPPRTLGWLVMEKLPLLALSAASAVVTLRAQHAGGTMGGQFNAFSPASRLANAVIAYVRYLGQAIWPAHLAFFYPHDRTAPSSWRVAAACLLLVSVTVLSVVLRGRRRYLMVGWLWFLGTMVPMIGLVQVGAQAMADRYAYLPFVGLFLAAVWGFADWAGQWRASAIWAPACGLAIVLLLPFATRRQLSYWSDDLTLWTHTAENTKNNYFAENMIGETLLLNGDPDTAIAHFRASVAMDPLYTPPRLHIGIYEEEHRHPAAAIRQFQQVLDMTQAFPELMAYTRSTAWVHMSYAYNQLGDYANQQRCMEMAAHARGPEADSTD